MWTLSIAFGAMDEAQEVVVEIMAEVQTGRTASGPQVLGSCCGLGECERSKVWQENIIGVTTMKL